MDEQNQGQFNPNPTPNPTQFNQPPVQNPAQFNQPPVQNPAQFNQPPVQNPAQFNQPPVQNPAQFNQPPVQNPAQFNQQPPQNPGQFNQPPVQNPAQFNQQPPQNPGQFNQQPPQNPGQYYQQPPQNPGQYYQQPAQNPGQYNPGPYGQPPMPPKKKNKGLLIAVIAVVAAAALAVGGIFGYKYFFGEDDDSEDDDRKTAATSETKETDGEQIPEETKAPVSGSPTAVLDFYIDIINGEIDDLDKFIDGATNGFAAEGLKGIYYLFQKSGAGTADDLMEDFAEIGESVKSFAGSDGKMSYKDVTQAPMDTSELQEYEDEFRSMGDTFLGLVEGTENITDAEWDALASNWGLSAADSKQLISYCKELGETLNSCNVSEGVVLTYTGVATGSNLSQPQEAAGMEMKTVKVNGKWICLDLFEGMLTGLA